MKKNWITWLVFIIAVELIGNIGSLATFSQIEGWYATLNKPAFNPPNWIFGPVWTILYALMGVALYRVWAKGEPKDMVRKGIWLFAIQMALNVLWSFVFFGFHQIGLAFLVIVILDIAIFLTALSFYKIDKPSGWLLLPYQIWVLFATILTLAVWQLN